MFLQGLLSELLPISFFENLEENCKSFKKKGLKSLMELLDH